MGLLQVILTVFCPADSAAQERSLPDEPSDTTSHWTHGDTTGIATGRHWGGTIDAQVRWRRHVWRKGTGGLASDKGITIGGLVINDTRTTIGRDFYSAFYSRWETPPGAESVMVRVREQPRPNLGTRLIVEVEETTIFKVTLRPDMQRIRRAARAALARTHRYLKERYEPRETY